LEIEGAAMTQTHAQELQENPVVKRQFVRSAEDRLGVKFARNNEFQADLRRRVDEFFENTGLRSVMCRRCT
jgi:hypothetical protein